MKLREAPILYTAGLQTLAAEHNVSVADMYAIMSVIIGGKGNAQELELLDRAASELLGINIPELPESRVIVGSSHYVVPLRDYVQTHGASLEQARDYFLASLIAEQADEHIGPLMDAYNYLINCNSGNYRMLTIGGYDVLLPNTPPR